MDGLRLVAPARRAAFPIRGGQNFSFEQEREIALSVIHCRDRRDEAVRMGLCTKVYQKVDFNEEKHALSANARFCPAPTDVHDGMPRQAAAARSQRLPSGHPLFC